MLGTGSQVIMTAVPLIGTNLTLVGLTLGTVNNSTKKSLNDGDEEDYNSGGGGVFGVDDDSNQQ